MNQRRRRSVLRGVYAAVALVAGLTLADAVSVRLPAEDFEAVLQATPERLRSPYVNFVLSTRSGWFRERENKVSVLEALRENYENGGGDISFDEDKVIALVHPRYSIKEADEPTPDRAAAFLIASTGNLDLIERALETHSRDIRAAKSIVYWFVEYGQWHRDRFRRYCGVVERYDAIVRKRFGADYHAYLPFVLRGHARGLCPRPAASL